ncbi:hypothetical protein [Brevundimonas sp.]|uniref:hypothetical protein n=1 Tax=Brevundimonas sp. TaxID=1871086 RepID=UPI002AC95B34|nr:hypothetical protein [Brevundimonas sp.]
MPAVVTELGRCRTVTDAGERLICLDAASSALDQALRSGDILIVDRSQSQQAQRQAFGSVGASEIQSPVPAEPPIEAVETTLVQATLGGDGRWRFVLEDGSVWRQIDTDRVSIRNRAGEPVRIRRAALGSYLLVVGRSGAIRVRRQ